MIVTNRLIKNVKFYILISNEGAICTATSNFIASHILITFRTLHNDVCSQGSIRGMIIVTQYKEEFLHCDISLRSVDTWKQTCHISATCLGLDYSSEDLHGGKTSNLIGVYCSFATLT